MARQGKAVSALVRGRDAYAARAWGDAHALLSRADESDPLVPADLELLATAAYMLGRDEEWVAAHERAHHLHLDAGDVEQAARAAFWIGLSFALREELGPAEGWFGRAQRLLDESGVDCVEQGFLLVPYGLALLYAGDAAAAGAVAADAAAVARRFGDRDLFALAMLLQGQAVAVEARVNEGLALLDEAMVAVTTGELSPVVSGIVYCGVIVACQEVFELRRAREWTRRSTAGARSSRTWSRSRDAASSTAPRSCSCTARGRTRSRRRGARASGSSRRTNPAAGLALYREAELLRLQGDFDGGRGGVPRSEPRGLGAAARARAAAARAGTRRGGARGDPTACRRDRATR